MSDIIKKQLRIKSLKRDSLPNLWRDTTNQDFIEILSRSTTREISSLFSCMNPSSINNTIDFLPAEIIIYIFDSLHSNTVNKIITACNDKNLRKIVASLDADMFENILLKCNQSPREKLISILPENERSLYKKNTRSSNDINSNGYYSSPSFENSLKNSIIERIRDLEEKETILEKNYKQKEYNLNGKIKLTEDKLNVINEQIIKKQKELISEEINLNERVTFLNNEIAKLVKEQETLQQQRLEIKFPEYVDTAVNGLKTKGDYFDKKSFWWNIQGGAALAVAILAAVVTFIYGGYQFNHAAKDNIDWLFFTFLLIKGLIIITLLGAWAKHAFNVANAYVHESLKRSDRMHAISFGKFYLEVYGNKVDQREMKDIFENWNINSDSAFVKIKESDFSLKQLDQITNIMDSIRKIKYPEAKS
ncbi:hypothetical protein [Enterobacter sp. 638]|uniref:Magnesium transporter MgtE intracellular domain-containing protein n=1 Tax=Enterobacter sp. (strain 638) TaxID=399742 RepID=A0A9J9GDI7_ENT38|nr:hypothetical protein [Enterobacter sp. 638]ABP58759.1 hypothetical protein Ent638_0069 [Enterobacter sp. 638]